MKRLSPLGHWMLAALALAASPLTYGTKTFAQTAAQKNWVIQFRSDKSPGVTTVTLGESYILRNLTSKKHVGYGARDDGVNLVWDAGLPIDSGNIRFERQGGSGVLKDGQVIAIHVSGGGYLHYKERKYGINLAFSKTPVYEWKLRLRSPTEPIQLGTNVALFNTSSQDYVVYCEREYGINLKWSKDCR